MDGAHLRRQEGFIRGILWLALILAIAAAALLDGMAIFTAHQSAKDDAATAAQEARNTYAVSQSVAAAKLAAGQYLLKANDRMTSFAASQTSDGSVLFTVGAKAHADTYAFNYLAHVPGLKKWVTGVTNPTAVRSAD
jgi:hypothetical protein